MTFYGALRGSQGLSEALGLSKVEVFLGTSTPFSYFVPFLPICIIASVSGIMSLTAFTVTFFTFGVSWVVVASTPDEAS